MLDQQTGNLIASRGSPTAWPEPAVGALRRSQPPPTGPRVHGRRERRFWGFLVLSVVLAALIPITAAVGMNVASSTASRILVAFAIPVLAGLAVTASAAATNSLPRMRRRGGGR